jgi:acetyltransferase
VLHSLFNSERPHALELCRYYNIPVYDSLDVACKCIDSLARYGNYLKSYHAKTNFKFNWGAKSKSDCNQIIANARRQGRLALLEHEGKQLLACHGGPVTQDLLATSADEAVQAAETHKGPVALKIVSADILHKSDAGGVRLNLTGKRQIRQAYSQIIKSAQQYNPDAVIEGVLVSPMVRSGVEVIVGTKIDDQFGPIIMYGLGGIMVEILKDISFRVLPISRRSAKNMILETKSSPILNGVRGKPPCDKKALVNLLLMVSELVEAYPDIEEMDLNPVIVHEEGLSIVDARIILKQN